MVYLTYAVISLGGQGVIKTMMDWSGWQSAPLHVDVRSHLSSSTAIQPLAASEESWHHFLVLFYTIFYFIFLILVVKITDVYCNFFPWLVSGLMADQCFLGLLSWVLTAYFTLDYVFLYFSTHSWPKETLAGSLWHPLIPMWELCICFMVW